jgi:hypothetical protein
MLYVSREWYTDRATSNNPVATMSPVNTSHSLNMFTKSVLDYPTSLTGGPAIDVNFITVE